MSRLLVEFGPDQAEALDTLSRRLGTTKADLLRRSLALMQVAVRAVSKGDGIGIVSSGRVVSELVGPWSEVQQEARA